ncbi:hypothetical protein [Prosthecobacter sp.]|jgi:hypothetical protein|uniref:hypothetical protein n=1 Tax=Prosthecobacter sp. TaxID=1965333 RepID=UPI0037840682
MNTPVLLGNSYPLSLVRRRVVIEPRPLEELRTEIAARGLISFWGHANTLTVARHILGYDPTPPYNRPALTLDAECLPSLSGQSFDQVWLLSPDYRAGFRPEIGKEVGSEDILGWQVLSVVFVQTSP